jgi:hypothetical protein
MAIARRLFRWLAVTVWFGFWALGLAYLVIVAGVDDPRNPFPDWMSLLGCAIPVLGWLYLSIYFALYDEMPDGW